MNSILMDECKSQEFLSGIAATEGGQNLGPDGVRERPIKIMQAVRGKPGVLR